jgi:predicted Zn-dependent protease
MSRLTKKQCPKCGIYTIVLRPEVNALLIDECAKNAKNGQKLTKDKMFNKILSEYFFIKDTKGVIV